MVRTAIQDANAGTTRIAQRATTSAKVAVTSPGISIERSDLEMAIPVIEATSNALQSANKIMQTNAAQEAAMRQGVQEGVNEVDAANKRGKFMSFLFGQDAGYSTAVSIATKNFAQNEYLRQMQSVEDNIDKTPEEYQAYLSETVTKNIADKFQDDPEAKTIALDQWSAQSRKLAREHTAKHMVYAQEQTFGEGVRDLTGQFDDIALNMSPGSTQAAQNEALAELTEILNPNYTYVADDGAVASKVASRNIQLQAVTNQLAAGNFTVLRAMPANFKDGMTVTQMNKLDQAFQQYDNAQAREGELIVEQGLLAAESGNVAQLQGAIQRLHLQKNKLSGSTSSKEKWTEDKRRLQASLSSLEEKQAKANAERTDWMEYYKARESGHAANQGVYYSKKNQEKADDAVVMVASANIARELGLPDPKDIGEAVQLVLNNPTAMTSVALRAERYGSISETLAEAAKARVMNIQPDEKGYIPQDKLAQLNNLRILYDRAPAEMRKALGTDASAILELTLSNSYEPVKEIQNKRTNYVKNKGLALTKQELGLPSDQTISDWIKARTDKNLDPASLTYYKTQLQTGYRIYGGDTKAAQRYMQDMYKINNAQWKGRTIQNAGIISAEVDVPMVLNHLENTGMGQALIESRISKYNQDPTNPIRGFGQLPDAQFSVNPGTKELVVQSSVFSYPIVVGLNELNMLSEQARIQSEKRVEELRKAELARYKEQTRHFWPTPQQNGNKTYQYRPVSQED